MTQEGQALIPPVMWAQRKDILFVTICLEECKDPVVDVQPEKIYFKGVGGPEKKLYELTIELFNEVVPDKTVQKLQGRNLQLVLSKKEEGPYWPRLLKEKQKAHWLKSDFNLWTDEDDSDSENEGPDNKRFDVEKMMMEMGGLQGNGKPDFDELDDEDGPDSDDDDIPELE